jgi:hypothetical protein
MSTCFLERKTLKGLHMMLERALRIQQVGRYRSTTGDRDQNVQTTVETDEIWSGELWSGSPYLEGRCAPLQGTVFQAVPDQALVDFRNVRYIQRVIAASL